MQLIKASQAPLRSPRDEIEALTSRAAGAPARRTAVSTSRFLHACRGVLHAPGFMGLLAMSFVLGLATSFVFPFLSLWGTRAVGMSPLVFGLFMTITSVSAISLSTLLARWSDTRVPRRTILLLGGSGGLLGYAGYAFLTEPVLLTLVGSLALGVASVSFSQLFAHAREELDGSEGIGRDAPLLLSVLRACFSLAWTVGPALAAVVMQHFEYRGTFLTAASLFAVFLVLVFYFIPERARERSKTLAEAEPLLKVLTRPVLLAHFLGFSLIFAAFSLNMMNLPLLITQELGGNARHVGVAFGIAPLVEIPLMIWFGRLAARGHGVRVIAFGIAVGACYFLALIFAVAPSDVYPMQILSAASVAVTMSVVIPFFQDLLPGQPGVATSMYSNSYSTGCLLGYLSFGLWVERIGHRGLLFLCAALSSITLMVFVLAARRSTSPPVGLTGTSA